MGKRHVENSSPDVLVDQARALLLPNGVVESTQFRIVSHVKSAQSYGGDWWGFTEVPRKKKPPLMLLMMGDATGHGVPAALVAATVRGALSVISSWAEKDQFMASDPRELLTLLNRTVFDAARGSMMMTLCAVALDPALGVVRIANAGHCFPYVIDAAAGETAEIKALGEGGVALGNAADTQYQDMQTYSWRLGSKLFLYTDGLTENYQEDQNLFDRRALQKVLRAHGQLPAQELLDTVLAERSARIGALPQQDDVSIVICEAK